MAKKKAIKLAAASAIAASAFVAAAPAQTDAASNVATEVSKAVTQMKKAYHTYSDVTATGDFADIKVVYKEYNAAKTAYNSAKALVSSSKDAAKDAYLAQLDSTYAEYIAKRVVTYIDAYNYATTLADKQADLEAALVAKDWDGAEELYHAISYELKTRTVILDRVYGKSTRELLRASFKADAQAARDSIAYEVTVKIALDKAADLVEAGKLVEAKAQLDKAAENAAKIDKDADFGKDLVAEQATVKAAYEAKLTPAVESVTALNAREIQVVFNKQVAEAAAETTSNYTLAGEVISSAVLSEDGKTVTLTTADELKVTNSKLTVASIATKADAKVKTTEFNTLLTFADSVAPVVAKVEAKGTTAVITFAEHVQTAGTVSLNGVALTSGYTLNGKTLTLTGLTAEKSYRVDLVGAKDFANNIANPIALNFTVEKPVVDTTKPAVTSSVNGTVVTFDFSEELAKQDLNGVAGVDEYAKVTVGSQTFYLTDAQKDANDKTKFTLDVASVLGSNAFINTTVKVEGFKDASNNAGDAYSFSTTLQADKTAPTLVSTTSKILVADNASSSADADVVYLTFSEPVTVNGNFTLSTKNGILYTAATPVVVNSTSGVDVDGNGKVEGNEANTIAVSVDLDKNSSYSYVLSKNSVTDASGNKIASDLTVNFNTADFVAAPSESKATLELAATPVVVGAANNVFTVQYATNVGTSALTAANYTLGGQALPAGTTLQFVDGTSKVRVTLPEGSIVANGSYILEVKNVADANGNTLKDGKASTLVALKESVSPTASSVSVVNSKQFTVAFSENVQLASGATAVTGVVVKVKGVEVSPANLAVVDGKLSVTTSADFGLADSISVEFKSASLADVNGNKVKDGSVSK